MWTVTLRFGGGSVQTYDTLTKDAAKRLVNVALFNNLDCISATAELEQVDPRDQPDYPTE